MATANVYSPISGSFWSGECYCYITSSCPCNPNPCTNPAHPCYHCRCTSGPDNWSLCCPMDIGGANAGDAMYFYTDCIVSSVKTYQFQCGCSGAGSPWTDSVLVELWSLANGTGTKIGAVVYHHVASRIADGTYNAGLKCRGFAYWALQVGNFTTDCKCGCYNGIHVHMERDPGGSSNSFTCGSGLTGGGGGTSIYSWNF